MPTSHRHDPRRNARSRRVLLATALACAASVPAFAIVRPAVELTAQDPAASPVERASRSVAEADAATAAGDLERARTALRDAFRALEELADAGTRADVADLRWSVAVKAARATDYDLAREAFERVLAYRVRTLPDDHADVLKARSNLGGVLNILGESARAKELLERVLEVQERTLVPDDPKLQATRGNLAATLSKLGDLAAAQALQEQVLHAFEQMPEGHPYLMLARRELAGTLLARGDLAGARALAEKLLAGEEQSKPAGDLDLQRARLTLASIVKEQGDLDRAQELSEQACAGLAAKVHPDDSDLAAARYSLADVLLQKREVLAARALFETVLASRERRLPAEHTDIQHARFALALCKKAMGDVTGARALIEDVLAAYIRTLGPDAISVQLARGNLAHLLRDAGDVEGSLRLYEQVHAAFESTLPPNHVELQTARYALAQTRLDAGDAQGARELLQAVDSVWRVELAEDDARRILVRESLAVALRDLGQLPESRAAEEEVLAARKASLGIDAEEISNGLVILSTILSAMGDGEALERTLAELVAFDLRRASTTPALSVRETEEAARARHVDVSILLSFTATDSALRGPILELIETLRALPESAQRARLEASASPPVESLHARVVRARNRLGDLVSSFGVGSERGPADPDVLAAARERDEAELALSAALLERGARPLRVTVEALARALPEGAVAASFSSFRRAQPLAAPGQPRLSEWDEMVAHVVRRDRSVVRIGLGRVQDVEQAVQTWRSALGGTQPAGRGVAAAGVGVGSAPSLEEAGRALRARVLDPVLAACGDARRIHLCLDGALHEVPLDTLPLDAGLIGDRYRLHVETSWARVLDERSKAELPAGELLALGGLDYAAVAVTPAAEATPTLASVAPATPPSSARGTFAALPATAEEVVLLKALFQESLSAECTILTGREATKAVLCEKAARARYLHLATHGYFAEQPSVSGTDASASGDAWWRSTRSQRIAGLAPSSLCGLALSGASQPPDASGSMPGIITAEELSTLDLSRCELVTLSACETAVGVRLEGRGMASLQKALHTAGARSMITSLWKVPDEATKELMIDFYRRLWIEKKPKHQALWEAKTKLRNAKDESGKLKYTPRDWAAWVLTGDPD